LLEVDGARRVRDLEEQDVARGGIGIEDTIKDRANEHQAEGREQAYARH
jgi:hypothetical protein